ncbi:hypothetical protein F5Y09DRAFT_351473 [Xylaria sp. FL1042]|nr:hypothetical protein F5Y09DRAFT_351473 [Xylaria sp. FL1042]
MVTWALIFCVTALVSLAPPLTIACKADMTSLSWKVTEFEWRTGYVIWSYYIGVGPAPPPPPTQFFTCGEAMLRMNISSLESSTGIEASSALTQEQVTPCVEQTNDAKLANITDMTNYNAGPSGPPPASPHWFTCDMNNQLFIFPNGTIDPWANTNRLGNLTTKIEINPMYMTLEIRQSWACDNEEFEDHIEFTGIARLPPLTCKGRPSLEPDANFLINSPVMHGQGYGARVLNGSVCTGPEFIVKAAISQNPKPRGCQHCASHDPRGK